ncbi:MAG: hypothetical protein HQL66_15355, partial [Magnetococcales bacterium]|nr:hypothetical protein [Magnetococcales bacterium]
MRISASTRCSLVSEATNKTGKLSLRWGEIHITPGLNDLWPVSWEVIISNSARIAQTAHLTIAKPNSATSVTTLSLPPAGKTTLDSSVRFPDGTCRTRVRSAVASTPGPDAPSEANVWISFGLCKPGNNGPVTVTLADGQTLRRDLTVSRITGINPSIINADDPGSSGGQGGGSQGKGKGKGKKGKKRRRKKSGATPGEDGDATSGDWIEDSRDYAFMEWGDTTVAWPSSIDFLLPSLSGATDIDADGNAMQRSVTLQLAEPLFPEMTDRLGAWFSNNIVLKATQRHQVTTTIQGVEVADTDSITFESPDGTLTLTL